MTTSYTTASGNNFTRSVAVLPALPNMTRLALSIGTLPLPSMHKTG